MAFCDDYPDSPICAGGGGSEAAAERLKFDKGKYAAEAAAAAATLARQQAGARAQEDYLRQQFGLGIPKAISGEIDLQEKTGKEYIGNQYANLLGELTKRKTAGEGATTTGYSNLIDYLTRNQPTAFAQAQRAQPQVAQSGLTQYMASQGVSPGVAQEAANIGNVQAAGGAANFNSLLNVLTAREQAGQQSRQSEAEMGKTSALANLEAIYGQGTASLESAQLAALQELATAISNARLQSQRESSARDQSIKDALAALYGTGYVTPPPAVCPPGQTKDANGNCVVRNVIKTESIGSGASRVKRTTYSDGTTEDTADPDASGGNPALTPEVLQALAARRGMAF